MAEFTVVLYRDDARDAALTDEERERAWAAHSGFQALAAEKGWKIVATRALGAAVRDARCGPTGARGSSSATGPTPRPPSRWPGSTWSRGRRSRS